MSETLTAHIAVAQGGSYNVQRYDHQSQSHDEDGVRYTQERTRSRSLGNVRVDMIGENAHNVRTRVQWLSVAFGLTSHWLTSSFIEHDFGDHLSVRLAGTFGWTGEDHGRELAAGGEVSIWLHTRRFESTTEHLILDFQQSFRTDRGPWVDTDGDGHVDAYEETRHSSGGETSVNVPGYRSRMIGAELGLGTWWGYRSTREESGARFDRGLLGYAFGGFSSGWVSSSMYYVDGYGTIGKSRYHKVFAHIMYAPLVTYDTLTDVSEQPPQFPFGLRVGVENMYGRGSALTFRAEVLILPAGGTGMVLLTLGFGSMFVSTT